MENEEKQPDQTKKRSLVSRLLWLVIIGAVILVGGHYAARYLANSILYESTDDAFIDGHIVSISAKVSGQISQVHVEDNEPVQEGDLLITIDPRDYQARVNARQAALQVAQAVAEKAQASIAAARAEANRAETDLQRYEDLKGTSSVSKHDLDKARAAALSAQAQLEAAVKQAAAADAGVVQAKADLEQAKLDLSYTTINAPRDGRVAQKNAEAGSYVSVGQPLMALIPYQIWVTANFKETQLNDLHPGQRVRITVDAFPGKTYEGHIDSVQAGTGSRFSLLPPENATGNYVKVVQRVPVKIVFNEPMDQLSDLGLGMSVEPKIYTGGPVGEQPVWLRLLETLGGVRPRPREGDNT